MPRNVAIPRFEEEPNRITAHSMPPVRRRAALIQNDTNLLNRDGRGGAQAMRPEQAKQIIRRKGILTFETAAISLWESPTFLSTTEHWVS